MKKVKIIVALMLCLATVLGLCACGGKGGSSYKLTVVDKTEEEAVKAITDAGCIPAVVSVYDEANADGAVLSFGDLLADAKAGDVVTVAVNDLSIKEDVLAQLLAPRIIPADSYTKKIYDKISSDENLVSVFDSMYRLKTAEGASERELEGLYRVYPQTRDMDIYVLDSDASAKELAEMADYISKNTDYTAEDMFNDYVTVGIVPTPNERLKAELITKDNCEYTVTNDGVIIDLYTGTAQTVVVPSELDGTAVYSLGEGSVTQSDLHGVIVSEGVTTLAEKACSNAYGVMNIEFSSTVMDVGYNAFKNALFVETQGDYTLLGDILVAYSGADTEIVIPEGVKFIGAKVFEGKTDITAVTLPEGLISIGNAAFKDCEGLTALTIPESVLKICDNAFYRVRHVPTLTIPASVVEIGTAAFYEWNDVTALTIGEGVKKIGDDAFVYLQLITELDIPESVEYIGNGAFAKCKLITKVSGGEGLKFVGTGVFEEVQWYIDLSDEYSYISNGILVKYNNKDAKEVVLPAEVTCISGAFFSNKKITNVVINDGCTAITKNTFVETIKLESVTVPASVTYIDPAAFDKSNMEVVIHCEPGSAAETFAKENFFKYDNEM